LLRAPPFSKSHSAWGLQSFNQKLWHGQKELKQFDRHLELQEVGGLLRRQRWGASKANSPARAQFPRSMLAWSNISRQTAALAFAFFT
jgi:hypothetical protein